MITNTSPRRAAIAAIALGLAACVLAPATVSAAEAAKRDRVVMQVSDNDPAKWNLALNNAHNLQQALGPKNVDVEIVAYGPGINMFKAESAGRQPDRRRHEGGRQVRGLREHDARDEAHQGGHAGHGRVRPRRRRRDHAARAGRLGVHPAVVQRQSVQGTRVTQAAGRQAVPRAAGGQGESGERAKAQGATQPWHPRRHTTRTAPAIPRMR